MKLAIAYLKPCPYVELFAMSIYGISRRACYLYIWSFPLWTIPYIKSPSDGRETTSTSGHFLTYWRRWNLYSIHHHYSAAMLKEVLWNQWNNISNPHFPNSETRNTSSTQESTENGQIIPIGFITRKKNWSAANTVTALYHTLMNVSVHTLLLHNLKYLNKLYISVYIPCFWNNCYNKYYHQVLLYVL